MASLEKTIAIVFQGDDRLSRTLKGITRGFSGLDSMVTDMARPLAQLGDGILAVDAALSAMATGSLVYAYARSMAFENSMIELKKVVGDVPEDLARAKKAAMALSGQYGESSAEILLSAADFKQAGFDISDSLTLTKKAMDLVIAGDMDAAEASDLLVASLKGFKAPASEAGRLIDILNEVSNNYATNVEQLAVGMSRLSPIARVMGFSFEETAGILTPVIEIFRSGDDAAMALKTGLLKLIDDSKPVQDALAAIGVAQKDANGNLRSGRDILFDVAKAFEGLSENKKLFLTQQLVGIHQAARMVEVFDSLAKTTEITSVALHSAGSASREVAARLEGSEVAVKRFKAAFENLSVVVGDQFRAAATRAVGGGTEIENVLRTMVTEGTFDPVFSALNTFADRIDLFLREVAAALPDALEAVDWSGLIDSLGDLGDTVAGFFSSLDLTDPEGLSRAIQGVVDTIESLVRVTEGMVEYFRPMWDAVQESIGRFNEMDNAARKAFGNLLGAAEMVVHAGVAVAAAMIYIRESGAEIENVFNTVAGSVRFGWNVLQTAFDTMVRIILNGIRLIVAAAEGVTRWIPGLGAVHDRIAVSLRELDRFDASVMRHQMEQMEEAANGWARAMAGLSGSAYRADDAIRRMHDRMDALRTSAAAGIDIPVKVHAETADEVKQKIRDAVPKDVSVQAKADAPAMAKAAAVLEEKFPAEKKMTVSPRLETRALERDAKSAQAILETLSTGISSTGSVLSDLFGELGKTGDVFKTMEIERQIQAENNRRKQALDIQKKLAEAQADYMRARTAALRRGDAVITVQGDGLKPHLEAFMWEILSAIQVRANEDAAEFLLGIHS